MTPDQEIFKKNVIAEADEPSFASAIDRARSSAVRPGQANFLQKPAAAYVHIPFCVAKCGYCDFVSYAGRAACVPAYVRAVTAEIHRTARNLGVDLYGEPVCRGPLKTVYFGGGTPGDLPASALLEILAALKESFGLEEGAEVTLEVNPGTASPGLLPAVRAGGFNRLSIGLQTASDQLLKKLSRRHTVADFDHLLTTARTAGFTNISADMMLALPTEELADSLSTARFLLERGLPHISFYSLTVEPGTPFDRLYPAGLGLPDDVVERQMYKSALALFKQAGYRHYEVSNVALPGFESQHNLTYWRGLPYYGFGCGAAAFIGGRRYLQTADLDAYMAGAGAGTAKLEEEIGEQEAVEEFFFLGFRTADGVSAADFRRQFGKSWPAAADRALADLLRRGLIRQRGGCYQQDGGVVDQRHYCLTDKGLDWANQVYLEFLDLASD